MIITFDPLKDIQRSLVRWTALAKALLYTSFNPNSDTQPKSEITKPPGLTIPKKRSSLSENVTRKIYYHKTHDANTYSQAKPTPLRKSKPMLTEHHSSKLH
jgi:hypothetical protein